MWTSMCIFFYCINAIGPATGFLAGTTLPSDIQLGYFNATQLTLQGITAKSVGSLNVNINVVNTTCILHSFKYSLPANCIVSGVAVSQDPNTPIAVVNGATYLDVKWSVPE